MNWLNGFDDMRQLKIHQAIKVLGLQSIPQRIREAYLQLAKVYHPDVSSSNNMKQWNVILDAYQLLQS